MDFKDLPSRASLVKQGYLPKDKQKIGPWQRAWLRTLKSGDFVQCDGSLCLEDNKTGEYSFCCLGVACEVALENDIQLEISKHTFCPASEASAILYDGEDTVLSERLVELFAFHGTSGEIVTGYTGHTGYYDFSAGLVDLNDTFGYTFEEIAKFVERFPEMVFSESA